MNDHFFYIPDEDELNSVPLKPGKSAAAKEAPDAGTADHLFDSRPAPAAMDCSGDFLDLLSTHFLICNDRIQGKGEDCGLEAYTCEGGVVGVFDGCGGLGARTCPTVSDKTEAYLASRAVGAAARQWFFSNAAGGQWRVKDLKEQTISNLELCQKQAADSGVRFRGSMIRPFPSTIAMITFRISNGKLLSKHIWAGDSRTYILDGDGLGQISADDVKDQDAMRNLTKDGALTNVVSADKRFVLHSTSFSAEYPCIMFCATDGCFGYVSSPMEFEYMILAALAESDNAAQWQRRLSGELFRCSGDDQTIAVAAFGFDSFAELKAAYADRCRTVRRIVEKFAGAGPEQKQRLWEAYKPGYYRYTAKKCDNDGSNTNQ